MKCSSETLQNLLYFMHTKTQSCFLHFSFRASLFFFPNECPGLCRHRPGTFIGEKNKVAGNEKWKKELWVFVYIKYGKF